MNTQDLITPAAAKVISDALNFFQSDDIVSVVVTTDEQFMGAGELLKRIDAEGDKIEKSFHELKDPITKAGKEIDAEFNAVRAVKTSKRIFIDGAMTTYDNQKKIELRQAQDEADRIAKEKQDKLLKEAEEREQKATAHADSGKGRLADYQANKAEELKQQAAEVVSAPVTIPAIPKIAGVQFKRTWKGRVTDKKLAMKYAVEHGFYHFFEPVEGAINNQAKSCDGEVPIPGIEWYQVANTQTRRSTW